MSWVGGRRVGFVRLRNKGGGAEVSQNVREIIF